MIEAFGCIVLVSPVNEAGAFRQAIWDSGFDPPDS